MMARILLMTFLLCLVVSAVFSLQCLDPNGNFVDWYSTYKVPKIRDKTSLFKNGLAHYYLDVNAPTWSLSKRAINDSGTAVYNTLKQIYTSQSADTMYVMYNDESPDRSKSDSGGHTKGVVGFDGKSGFWLIHSVPSFPPNKEDGFSYPSSGTKYGQTFLCISLPYSMLGQVGKQLLYNQPHIYNYSVPQSMSKDFPVLNDVINRRKPPGPPWYSVLDIKSLKGQTFTSFAKASYYGEDLYGDLVAPSLKTSLVVESWMDGTGPLPDYCNKEYKVYNSISIDLPGDTLFKRTKDHSKWATAMKNSTSSNAGYWTCVGDINRMHSQFKRGGGTACIDDVGVWKAFRQSVHDYVQC